MPDERLVRNSAEVVSGHSGAPEAQAREERRRYNREFMRRWRADPSHHAMERSQRQQRYYGGQKQQQIEKTSSSRQRASGGKRLCGFCWRRPALRKIVRLQVSEAAPDGYVKVRIPYCGEC